MNDTDMAQPEIVISGKVPNEDAAFQIGEALEDCGHHGSAHVHFELREQPNDPLVVRIKLEGRQEQQIRIEADKMREPRGIRKSIIDQLQV